MKTDKVCKVFGIGLHRTGTTTLEKVLEQLGYNVCPHMLGYRLMKDWYEDNYSSIIELAQNYDGFQDSPWCHPGLYKVLDREYPTSKFILTVRDPERWFSSLEYLVTKMYSSLYYASFMPKDLIDKKSLQDARGARRFLGYNNMYYGKAFNFNVEKAQDLIDNKATAINTYLKHNKDAIHYFRDKPRRLLVINWEAGDGWDKVCSFLGRPIPKKWLRTLPMPWQNKRPNNF
tara:strand:- start:39331 stop:40023 length:693 start_codon:yes stop_codon:yes gene_type:complete